MLANQFSKNSQLSEMISVWTLSDSNPLWEEVRPNNLFSIYHTEAWKKVVEDTFGHTAIYMAASKFGKLIEILPLFLIHNPVLGKKLVSTPYEGCHGGFSSSEPEIRKVLVERVLKYAKDWNVRYVEIRSRFPVHELKGYGFIEKTPFIITEIPLRSLDDNMKMLSPKHRRNVRIAQKKGVSVVQASNWEQMETFYNILAGHYKNLGNPFFGKIFFKQIWGKLVKNNYACLLLAMLDEEIIGGHLLFFSGKTLISKYSAAKRTDGLRKVNASYALYWEAIRLGIQENCTLFNLGITGEYNSGLLDFKTRFGASSDFVHFYYYPISGKIPDYRKYYHSYSLLKKFWSVAPSRLTSLLGQKINKWIC